MADSTEGKTSGSSWAGSGIDQELAPDILATLQALVLESVLTGKPLPGASSPLTLPDLAIVLRGPSIALSTENLGGAIRVTSPPKPIHILSPETIQARARESGEFAYLGFQPPSFRAGKVLLTLQARVARGEEGGPELGLSGVQAAFRQAGGHWQIDDDEPRQFAA